MALKTCTGTTSRPYVHVQARLSQAATITATGANAPLVTNATGAANGTYSIPLHSAADLTPTGTTVTVTEYLGSIDNSFTVQVPNTGKTITGAANNGSGLIRITAATHGFSTGNKIDIGYVTGTTEANGLAWVITVFDVNSFDLVGSTFANAYISGGIANLPYAMTGILSGAGTASPTPNHVSTLTVDGAAIFTAGPLTLPAESIADEALSENIVRLDEAQTITGVKSVQNSTSWQANAAGDISGRSFTASASGPYAALLPGTVGGANTPTPPGVLTGLDWDWGGNVFNIKAAGALVDGVTDDTTPIGLGIVAGGAVALGKGTAIFSVRLNSAAKANWQLSGAGRDVSTLKAAANTNPVTGLLVGGSSTTFADFTLDGNKANQAGGNGIQTQTKQTLRNVRILNVHDYAIQHYGATDLLLQNIDIESCGWSAIALDNSSTRSRVLGSRIESPGGHGILGAGSPGTTRAVIGLNILSNVAVIAIAVGSGNKWIVAANYIQSSLDNAVDIAGGSDLIIANNLGEAPAAGIVGDNSALSYPSVQSAVVVIGNIMANTTYPAHGATPGYAISYNGRDSVWVGNIAHETNGHGMLSGGGQNLVWVGNLVKNSSTPSPVNVNFKIDQNSGGVLMVGNRSFDDRVTKTAVYGLDVVSGAAWVYAFHNDLRGNLTGPLNDPGVGVYAHGNPGFNPRGALTPPGLPATTVIFRNPFNVDCVVYIAGGTLTAIGVGGLPTPAGPTLAQTATGGTLAAGITCAYRIAARNTAGHTIESTEVTIVISAGTNTNRVTLTMPNEPGAWAFDIYGRTTGAELLMASNWSSRTFVDDGSITPSGAMPGTDTTGNTATGITAAAAAGSVHAVRLPWGSSIKLTYTGAPTWTWFGE